MRISLLFKCIVVKVCKRPQYISQLFWFLLFVFILAFVIVFVHLYIYNNNNNKKKGNPIAIPYMASRCQASPSDVAFLRSGR